MTTNDPPSQTPLRVAVLGAGGTYRTPAAIARACRSLGHTARVIDVLGWVRRLGGWVRPLLIRMVHRFEPDLVLFTVDGVALGLPALTALARRYRTVFWHFDGQRPPTPKAAMMARATGATFTTCLPLVEEFLRVGAAEAHFLPQGVDPEVDCPALRASARYRSEVLFIGSGQYPHRENLLRAVARTAQLQIRGPGWQAARTDLPVAGGKVLGPAFARAVAGAAVVLGANALPEQEFYPASASNRMWKVLGCGGFYLGPWVESIDRFARDGEHCAWYHSIPQAVALVRQYLDDPPGRERIARAGRAHALAHHTYAHRLPLLIAGRGYTIA